MPRYDYQCPECAVQVEEMVPMKFYRSYHPICEACGVEMKRVFIAAPAYHLSTDQYVAKHRGHIWPKDARAAKARKPTMAQREQRRWFEEEAQKRALVR